MQAQLTVTSGARPGATKVTGREELVAELGSAFLCADLELHQEPREENAAYIATWLRKWRARHFSSNHQQILM